MDNYSTPEWILDIFENYFDPCPLNENPDINGLEIEWKDKTFVNPPYSKPMPWVKKAIEESKKGKRIVMLLKHDSSTKWYAKLHEANANILLFSKRLKWKRYGDGIRGAKDKLFTYTSAFPSMLVIL